METTQSPESEKPKNLKKTLLYISFGLDFVIVVALVWFFAFFPREEIQILTNGHVQVKLDKDKNPIYTIVKKKPKNWVSLKEMNYTAAHAIVVSEDWAFYQHNGYDLGQIKEAALEAAQGERARGASTISQQVVKNLFLTHDRTLSRKVNELGFSLYMERNVSKEKILETYLNIAEFGPGVYGIKAASEYYFKKSPKSLTPREGAFLAMLLPSPEKYSQSFREKELTEFAEKSVQNILEKMVQAKFLKEEQLESSKEEAFSWEKGKSQGKESVALKNEDSSKSLQKSEKEKGKAYRTRRGKRGTKKDLDGSKADARLGLDNELKLEENPEFDEDALVEDIEGLQPEFNVQ